MFLGGKRGSTQEEPDRLLQDELRPSRDAVSVAVLPASTVNCLVALFMVFFTDA